MDRQQSKNKRALVIFNPRAGLKTGADIETLIDVKLKSLNYETDWFRLDSGFEKRFDTYVFDGVKLVVAVGGDGTVKVAARTIIQSGLDLPLAIVPCGSANVVAVTLNIPINVKKALNILSSISRTVRIDVGLVNGRHYFLVGLSVGFFSKVVMKTTEKIKNRFGFLAYLLTLFFHKIRIKKIKFEIKTQNKIFWIKGNSLVVCNAINYFGIKPKRPVDLRDGILNLFVFTNKTFFDMVKAFFYVLWYHRPPKYIFCFDNDYFRIVLNRVGQDFQLDGDRFDFTGREIEVEVLKKALTVIAP